MEVDEIKEMIENIKDFMGEKEHYTVIDFGSSLGFTTEARDM